MKKLNFLKLISLIFVCALIIGTVAVTALAAEDQQGNVEIVAKNIYFGDNYKLQFAINAPEDVDVSATCNGAEIEIERAGEVTLGGVVYPIYQTVSGWAPQNINAVVTVTATAGDKTDVLCYSVLMYLYERLNLDGLDPEKDADRIELYETLLAHAKAADKVINSEENGRTPNELGKYHYVSVVGGTLDGYNDWGMFKEGDTPFASVEHSFAETDNVEWALFVDGEDHGLISLEELKAYELGANEVKVVASVVIDHVDHEDVEGNMLPVSSFEELVAAFEAGGNYYLRDNIEITQTVSVTTDVTLCLNGKKISRVGEEAFTMMSGGAEASLTLVDCGTTERIGYIDPETHLWNEGTYSGEGTAQSFTLTGGLITNGSGAGGRVVSSECTLKTVGVNFAGNVSEDQGSAINVSTSGSYTDNGSVFVGNTSTQQAGAVQVYGVTTLENTQFIGNYSSNRGGALLAAYGSVLATNVSFKDNVAATQGGAVVFTAIETVLLDGCTFENNSATRAGALYGTSNSHTITTGCKFKGNSSTQGGAVSIVTAATYVDGVEGQADKGSFFQNNTSTGDEGGGAIHSYGPASLYGTKFEGNTSTTNGGAVYTSNALTIDSCEFISNSAVDGGAIYAAGDTFTDNNSTFTSNTSTSEGGAVYITAAASLDGTSFDGNKSGPGGAIFIRNKLTNTLIKITLTNNKATNGSIYIGGAGVTYIEGMTATDNASTGHGGVIYATTAGTQVTVNSATLSGNTYTKNAIRGFIKSGNATTHIIIYKPGIVEDGLAGDDIPNWDEMIVPYNETTALKVTYLEEPATPPTVE